MDISLGVNILALLFMVAMLAGFVDAMAGGGGLLTIPALLLSGVPPIATLATNKLQACAGSFSASVTMIKKGVVRPKDIKAALIMAFVGSSVGTVLVQLSPPDMLKVVIPFLVAGVGLYTLFAPNLGQLESSPKVSQATWQKTAVPLIGFYDGYLGPGTGTFFALSNVALRGMNLIQATGTAKLLNFATNIASLIFFIVGGQVLWTVGLVMMAGQAIGAFFGSHMVVKGGAKFIRPVIVLMCFAMLIRFIWAG